MSNANALELIMLNLVNDEREAAGLEPLRLITLLNEAAEDHSQWMLEADQFSHQGEGGSTPTDRMDAAGYPFEGSYMSAENIGWQSARGAEGFEDDVAQIHEGLMASPGHRANILDPNAEDIGIGIEIGTFSGAGGDYEAVMATQVFGRTEADISAWVDPQTGDDTVDPPVIEDPVEDDMDDTDDQPVADTEDPIAEEPTDDDVATDDCPMEDETEDDAVEDEEDEVVADTDDPAMDDDLEDESDEDQEETEDDDTDDDPYDDDSDAEDDGVEDEEDIADEDTDDNEDVAENDEDGTGEETPVEMPAPGIPLPCDLSQFTVDLSEAFEFRQEGDQLIWETSEDKILAAFQKAFDEWTGAMEEPEADPMEALMLDEFTDAPGCMMQDEDVMDEWLLSDCA